jgi:hypothetical protein
MEVEAVPAELSLAALREAVYEGILEQPVILADGRFEGEPFVEGGASRPIITLMPEWTAYGGLDDDGRAEAAVFLVSESGGSGSFTYLAVIANREGNPVNLATTFLGDRIQVRSVIIKDGELQVGLLAHGPDGPVCCPTLEDTRVLRFIDNRLVEAEAVD